MSVRHFIPGIIWLVAMTLLFITPASESECTYFDCLPSRSLIHGILFWGFAHIWLGALKKQSRYELLRQKAFPIVFISAIVVALIAEGLMFLMSVLPAFSLWNLGFDILGTLLGMLTFRLLYASCY